MRVRGFGDSRDPTSMKTDPVLFTTTTTTRIITVFLSPFLSLYVFCLMFHVTWIVWYGKCKHKHHGDLKLQTATKVRYVVCAPMQEMW